MYSKSKLILLLIISTFLLLGNDLLIAKNQSTFFKNQVQPKPKTKKNQKKTQPSTSNQQQTVGPDTTFIKPVKLPGASISYGEFYMETQNFKNKYPNENFGGVIGKEKLQSLLYTMPPDAEWVNFYFGETIEMKKFVIFLQSDLKNEGYIVRNSVFCPDYCTDNQPIVNEVIIENNHPIIDTIQKPIIVIPEGEFMTFGIFQGDVSSYKGKYPNQTFGGVFGKNFLQEFLNTISPDVKTINFYFAETSDLKRYIILIPSGLKSDGYIIKNMEYCPENCKDNQ